MAEAKCDYCGTSLGCHAGSPEDDGYWKMSGLGLRICDDCLREQDPKAKPFESRVRHARGIDWPMIESECSRAEGVLASQLIAHVREAMGKALALFDKGERLAAMEAAQVAFERGNALFNALEYRPVINTGSRVRAPFKKANEKRSNSATERQKEWQHMADTLWARQQHAGKNKSDIARLIAKETGDAWGTIRRNIKHR